MSNPKKTAGDIFRVYVMPPSTAFPWVQLWHHPHGIRKAGIEKDAANASRDRDELVRQIGEMVVNNSPILQAWTEGE